MSIIKKEVVDSKIQCLIKSSNILETVYDTATKDLIITFNGGRVYQYKNVDPKVYQQFELSESHGKSFHQIFKTLPSTRLKDIDPNSLLTQLSIIK